MRNSEKRYVMQSMIVFFCLAVFYVVGLASLLLHLLREYRQYKTKRQTTSLPGLRPPITPVKRVPTRPVKERAVKPLYERQFDEIMTRGLEKWKEVDLEQ